MRKIVLANASEYTVETAGESSTPDGSKKTFTMTFVEYGLDELREAFMTPSNIKVIKLYDGDGELIRIVNNYDFYDIQFKRVNSKECIIVNLIIGDTLKQEVEKLQSQLSSIQDNITIEEDMDMMTTSELKSYKKTILQDKCRKIIYQGVDVNTSTNGVQHFSYNEDDQRNLEALFNSALISGMDIPYHADGESCNLYSADDIISIYISLQQHKLYHTTYMNALNRYIENLADLKIIKSITYGNTTLPKSYRDSMDIVLSQGLAVIQKVTESAKGAKK